MLPTPKSSGNSSWWTDPQIPDPEPLPEVRGWRILVRPIPNAPKSKGGIIIPDQTIEICLLYTSPSPRDLSTSRMPSSA